MTNTLSHPITIAQLSDLHLTGVVGRDKSYHHFLSLLDMATNLHPNLLLLTGDLVNGGDKNGYHWLFEALANTAIPFFCIAGNHDVTVELNEHLPFEYRSFLPITMDDRLYDCQQVRLGNWQLLLLNSTIEGKIAGCLTKDQLNWLQQMLSNNPHYAIIALHHHPIAVGSAWIDQHQLQNGQSLFNLVKQYPHAKLILCGHIHQAHTLLVGHTTLLTAPAISRQFLPFSDIFALDNKPSGFRLITLYNNTFDSQIIRLPSP